MRWVKASERLPDLYKAAPAKKNNLFGQLSRNAKNFVEFSWFSGVDSHTTKSENLSSIEWLDESTPEGVTADPRDEEIARLKEGLDAAREDEAIRFAEWASINYYSAYIGRDSKTIWSKNGHYTTEQLYQLYKKQTP